jgi:hypothetical protein
VFIIECSPAVNTIRVTGRLGVMLMPSLLCPKIPITELALIVKSHMRRAVVQVLVVAIESNEFLLAVITVVYDGRKICSL